MAEIACTVASNLVTKPLERLFAAIGRQFGYILCYKSYIEDLKKGVQELEIAQERVQHSVEEAKHNGKPIENDINNWLESVKKETEKADDLLKRGESAQNACFRGWLPNPVVRHPIGRKVKKITKVIQELHEKSPNNKFLKVYYENPVLAKTSAARSVDNKEDVLESRAKIMEEVMKAIVDDKVCAIGVYGPGGAGKTKLLKDVEKRVKKDNLFDMVAMAKVSCNPDLKRIQDEIIDVLGLHLMNEKTVRGRALRLRETLESHSTKKILIILDDLWEKLELEEIGIPCGGYNKVRGCKLFLTSRNRDVLHTSMGCDQEFRLDALEHREALKLFERTVGHINPEFEPLVDGVVNNCGGLPLLIVSSAKRLKDKGFIEWNNASTDRDLSNVKSVVELSYNDLKDERIKSLFLICALTSGRISTRDSLVYCMGLGLFKQFSRTIQNTRNRLIEDLRSLQDSSLLLESDDMESFEMHDIFADLAISIHDEFVDMKWNALVGKKDYGFKEWSEDELRKCTTISFSYLDLDKLPEKLDCPNLRMLLLLENYSFLKIPESFFESMKKLQVLHFAGLSFTSLTSSMQVLEHLKSLSLDDCYLEDVTVLGKLKGLRFLSFAKSSIARLPNEIGELTELRFLDLTGCFGLKIIAPGTLGSLVHLEELYIDSFRQWEAEDEAPRSNASLAELNKMERLSTLDIATPHSTSLSSDLPFGNLNKYKIKIGGIRYWWDKYKESRTLELELDSGLDSGNLLDEVWMQKCLGRTQDLRLDGSRDGSDSIHDLCSEGFQDLKHLYVQNNFSFRYVVDSTVSPAFVKLELLALEDLDKLEKICHCRLAPGSFSKLKIVKVENCCEIKQLFPSSMKKIFSQLEEIEITRCNLMQQIVADAEVDEYRDEIDDDANVKSCKLRRLTLENLREMMSFYKTEDHPEVLLDGRQVSLPELESLTLFELPKLKEIWNSQFPPDVTNLKFFKVEDCAFLLSIFPSNLVIKLPNLEAITIERCQLIREVFDLERLTTIGNVEILPRLTSLTLSDLPRLGYICNKNPRIALCFRNLRELKVQNCENLRFLFTSSMARGLQQIREIKIARCKLLEEIIDVQEEESEEATSIITLEFPLLTSLSLKELSNLKAFSSGTHCVHCPALTRMRIFKCPRMMTFASFKGKQQMITAGTSLHQAYGGANSSLSLPILFDQNVLFPRLEKLTLVSLGGLMKIWHNELSKESFCKLASVEVRDCENLSHIFPSTLIEGPQCLKMIEVVNCTSLESIIEHVAVNTKTRLESLVFSGMKEVKLQDLPRLNALLTSSSHATLSLPSLTNVSLNNCHHLRYLFTNDTSRTLDKLETLDVSGCDDMQQVVATEESDKRKLKAVKFSHLRTLKLCSLKSLISFGLGSCAYEFPYLENLSILECTKLKAFILRLPAPRVETLNEGSAGFHESPQSLFDEKVLFPSLKELTLVSLGGLMKIWHNELSKESFCKLASVKVRDCENLSHIFPSTSIAGPRSPKMIEVVNCTSLESIIEHAAVNTKTRRKSLVISGMKKLKLQDLPRLNALLTNSSQAMLSLPSLTNVSLSNCHRLRYLFTYDTSRTLDELEMLDVSGCNDMQQVVAPEESDERKLKAVKFSHLHTLKLCSLMSLISFGSGSCAYEFPSLENLSILECTELKAFILRLPTPRVEMLNEGSASFDESPHCLFDEKVLFSSLKELTLVSLGGLMKIWHNELSKESFCKLASVEVRDCENLSHIFPSTSIEGPRSPKMIEVVNCTSLESIIEHVAVNTKTRPESLVFSDMKELKLQDLPRLNALLTSSSQATLSLPSLTNVSLSNCHRLRYLFTYDTSRTLDELEMLDVSGCNDMQQVVAPEECDEQKLKAVKFSHLHTLKLCSLMSLISFGLGSCAYEFPSLENLSILECTELKALILRLPAPRVESLNEGSASFDESPHCLFDEKVLLPSLEELTLVSLGGLMKIWHNELNEESFCKLASVEVRDCKNLSHIFPSTLIERLQFPRIIEVVNCSSLESLIEHVAINTKTRPESLVFSGMKEVKLQDLPRLNALLTSSSHATLSLPSLTNVSLNNCHHLRYLFTNDTSRTLDKLERLDVSGCNNMQQVVATEESDERKLKTMKFSHLHILKLCSLKNLISFGSGSWAYEFPSLENLSILECTELKAFILRLPAPRVETLNEGSASFNESPHCLFDEKVVFPKLEELCLTGIQSRGLWENEMPNESVCQLKVLEVKQCPNLLNVIPSFRWRRLLHCMESLKVEECPRLINLFTMSMAKSLVQLKYLGLGGCGDMEYIVAIEEEKFEEAEDIIVIPQLGTLYLHKMKKLKSFCHEKHISKWPSLKEFTVEDCEVVEVILGDASCRRLKDSVSMRQPLLLVEKVEFPSMESMKISHMDNMEKIWLDELASNAFTKLKKLIVEYCEKLSSIFSSDSILTRFQNLEKLKVTDCGSLEVVFQTQELDMSGFHSTSTFQLRKLKLQRLQKMKHVWNGPPCGTFIFEHLQCLKAKNCGSLTSLFPLSIAKSMTRLKKLLVEDCGVEEIIAEEDGVGMSAGNLFFPQLSKLRLLELSELRRFYKNSHTSIWPLLKKLRVRHCGKMRSFSLGTTTCENQPTLFSFEKVIPNLEGLTLMSEDVMMMMQQLHVFRGLKELELACYHDGNVAFSSDFLLHRFPDLEELSLSCSSLEEIFPEGACGHGGATPYGELTDMETPLKALKNLQRLELNKLCKLQRVWKDGSLMAEILKRIETLLVSECSSLSIVLPSPTTFQRLTELEVKDCAGLVHMGTSSAATSLVHLIWLTLRNCGAMEDVVTDDGNGVEEISFPKLRQLTLDGLPSLESFSSVNCTFMFPSLWRIIVKQCPKMNIFCNGALSTPRLHEVCLSDEDYEGRWEGDLNTTIQFLST